MKNSLLLLLIAPIILLGSCKTSLQSLRPLLDDLKGDPKVNIEGEWTSDVLGNGVLIQKDNMITGSLGSYEVQGAVNGDNVYLLIGYAGTFYYSAILQPYKTLLIGKYSYSKLSGGRFTDLAYPLTLRKIKELK
jgi:hypothetical protein